MISDDIIAIKDNFLNNIGGTCEKIILFGYRVYGTPREDGNVYD